MIHNPFSFPFFFLFPPSYMKHDDSSGIITNGFNRFFGIKNRKTCSSFAATLFQILQSLLRQFSIISSATLIQVLFPAHLSQSLGNPSVRSNFQGFSPSYLLSSDFLYQDMTNTYACSDEFELIISFHYCFIYNIWIIRFGIHRTK